MADDMIPVHSSPAFDLTTFLRGRTTAWGIFEDRFGKVRRRFKVEMMGQSRNGAFFLDETFKYDDGTQETRVWRVVPGRNGEFTATCPDCVGTAHGRCEADTIRMSYRFRLKINAREIAVDFDDRIYRIEDGVAVNRATMSKWGVTLGELSLMFRRADAAA